MPVWEYPYNLIRYYLRGNLKPYYTGGINNLDGVQTMKPITQTNKVGFEVTTCGRCGGLGHYSRNSMGSTVCYECGGATHVLTQRGLKARKYLIELQERKVSECAVGMFVWIATGPYTKNKWRKITAVSPQGFTVAGCEFVKSPDSLVRCVEDGAAIDATIAKAVAYQATLQAT